MRSILTRAVFAGLVVAALVPVAARAQSFRTIGTGLEWGRFNVYPSVTFDYGHDDNIFFTSDDLDNPGAIVSSRELMVQPKFLFDLPMGDNWVRMAYAPLFRNYSTEAYQPSDQWSQNFDLDGRLRLGPRFYTAFRDRFVRGTQELRAVDPGGELTFGDVPFRSNTPSVEVGMNIGARQAVSVVWNYNSVQFEDRDEASFYNYRGHGLQARYNYRVSNTTTTYAYVGNNDTEQQRFSPEVELIDVEETSAGIGLYQVLNRSVTTSVSAGYQAVNYIGGSESNYRGPVLSATATWLLSDVTRMSFMVRRQPYSSFYLNNNYYLNRALGVDFTRQAGASWYWRVGGGFENNTYSDPLDITGFEGAYCAVDASSALVCPSQGERRRDRAWHVNTGVGFQISRTLRWFVGYNGQSRSSNILQADTDGFGDPFAYSVNRLFLRIEVGWL